MNTRTGARGAGPDPPPVDLDHHGLGHHRGPGFQLAAPVLDRLLVALCDEFAPDLVSQPAHLVGADLDPGHPHRVGGITERGEPRGGRDDALDDRGTEGVFIQPQSRS